MAAPIDNITGASFSIGAWGEFPVPTENIGAPN